MKSFFNLVKLETKRVMRNKTVFALLFLLPVIIMLIISLSASAKINANVAIYTDGANIEDTPIISMLEEKMKPKSIIEVDNIEKGKDLVRKGEAVLFIELNSETTPITATLIYDTSSEVAVTIKGKIDSLGKEATYEYVKAMFEEYGITLNDDFFNFMTFESLDGNSYKLSQRFFPLEVACFISLVMMFGLAFSISRDNETEVHKQLCYTPIGLNKYLLSKMSPYYIIGVIEFIVLFLIGYLLLNITFAMNVLLITLISFLFLFATLSLGLAISMQKNQIATAFIDMVIILIPIFVINNIFIESFPIYLRIVLYFFPISNFIPLLSYMTFNGIILWKYIIFLILQCVGYYLLTLLILKKKTRR